MAVVKAQGKEAHGRRSVKREYTHPTTKWLFAHTYAYTYTHQAGSA